MRDSYESAIYSKHSPQMDVISEKESEYNKSTSTNNRNRMQNAANINTGFSSS